MKTPANDIIWEKPISQWDTTPKWWEQVTTPAQRDLLKTLEDFATTNEIPEEKE